MLIIIMKSLIIDDHKINYVLIKNLLRENFPEVDTLDTADSVTSALAQLEKVNYDLIFLDMQLQDGFGFDVLREMTEMAFVIVVSSHKDYALEAFKYNVVDYIVKPINNEVFNNAVKKFLNLYKAEELKRSLVETENLHDESKNERLFVIYKNEYLAINKKDILFVRAQGKYSELHTVNDEQFISSRHLKEFEDSMSPLLLRVHHSYLVNVNCIVSYSKETLQVKLISGALIPVSVRKREELFKNIRVF